MNYGEILEKAWKIIWRFKVLWIFGLLASCGKGGGGGGGGGSNTSIPSGSQGGDGNFMPPNLPPQMQQFFNQMEQWVETPEFWVTIALLVLAFIVLMFVLSLVFVGVRSVGEIGLVRGTWQADEGVQHLPFGELFKSTFPYFWRVFLFIILLGLVGAVLGIAIAIPLVFIAIATLGIGLLCILPLLCLLIPLGLLVSAFERLVINAIVGEDLGIMDAVKRAWNLMKGNLGPTAVIALILFFGAGVVGVIIALPIILVMMPVIIGAIAGGDTALTGGLIISGGLLLVYIPIAILLGSVLQAYLGSAWTLTFRRLTGREASVEVVAVA